MRHISIVLLGLTSPLAAQSARTWPVAAVTEAGIDSMALDRAYQRAADMVPLTSLLVARAGVLIGEKYFRGLRPNQRVNVKSASKSIISALVGIAIEQSRLRTVDQRLAEFFPEQYADETDPFRWRISLRDLLTMRTGLETTSFQNYGRWVTSPNWVQNVLDRPFVCAPGSCWEYSTGSTHLLSAILTRTTGQSTLAFAREHLFGPLGVQLAAWERDPQGIYLGGNNMMLSPRELMAFGLLYASGGRYGDQQIISPDWIRDSWQMVARSRRNRRGSYGYGWWGRDLGGHMTYYAWGYGGQYVFVVPDLDLVVVATSSLTARRPRGFSQNREILLLMRDHIIPGVASGQQATSLLGAGGG